MPRFYTEYRFIISPAMRLTTIGAEDRPTAVRITGRPMERVRKFKAELEALLAAERPT